MFSFVFFWKFPNLLCQIWQAKSSGELATSLQKRNSFGKQTFLSHPCAQLQILSEIQFLKVKYLFCWNSRILWFQPWHINIRASEHSCLGRRSFKKVHVLSNKRIFSISQKYCLFSAFEELKTFSCSPESYETTQNSWTDPQRAFPSKMVVRKFDSAFSWGFQNYCFFVSEQLSWRCGPWHFGFPLLFQFRKRVAVLAGFWTGFSTSNWSIFVILKKSAYFPVPLVCVYFLKWPAP